MRSLYDTRKKQYEAAVNIPCPSVRMFHPRNSSTTSDEMWYRRCIKVVRPV